MLVLVRYDTRFRKWEDQMRSNVVTLAVAIMVTGASAAYAANDVRSTRARGLADRSETRDRLLFDTNQQELIRCAIRHSTFR